MPAVIEGYARPLEIASFLSKFLQTAMLRRTRQPANDPAKLSPQKNAGHVTQANSFPCSSQHHFASEPRRGRPPSTAGSSSDTVTAATCPQRTYRVFSED